MKKKLLVLMVAVCTFGYTNQTKAQAGAALNLDGNATYVDFGNNVALGLQSANFSMEAWVNPAGGSGGQLILFNGACNVYDGGWGLSYNGGDFTGSGTSNPGKLSFYVLSSVDNNYYQLDQQSSLPIGQWTHVAVTNDGTAIKMYINGVLDNTLTGNYIPVNTNSSLKIGADPDIFCGNTPRYVYNGSIDELRLFNYALNSCQINATMNCELTQSRAGLLLYAKFNEGVGNGTNTITTVADSSGNGFDGTMGNFALTGTTSNWVSPGGVTSGLACGLTTGNVSIKITNPIVSVGGTTTLIALGATSYTWTNTGATTTSITISPTVTTTYTLMGTDGACTGMGVLTVTVASPAAALNFDGVDDYVSVADNAALDFGTNDFTIEADFQSSVSQPDYAGIVVKSVNNGDPNGGYQLVVVGNNIAAEFTDGNGNFLGTADGLQGTSNLTDGNWHHLAMVVNRANNNIKLLVDGTVEADVTNTIISTTNVTNTIENMLIGVERTYSIYTNANIDEVRVWNRALCALEIQNNLNGELPTASRTGLVAYYKFNQGFDNTNNTTVSTLTDSSGHLFNGLLNNFALTGVTSNWVVPGAVTTGSTVTAFTNTLSAVASQTNVACNSDANGIASVAVTGIQSPFTYTWSAGGSTTNSATSLAAGNYTCTIGNACGTIAQTFTITQPQQLIATSTSGTIACNGGATTVTVSATGGTTNYTGTGTFTVTANSYTYTVTDANSCAATTTLTITEPAQALVATATAGTINCNGAATTVTVSATGGITNYIGTGTYTATANSYTYTVTDANSCTATTTITISQPNAITSTQSPTLCAGRSLVVGTNTYTTAGTYTDVLAAQNGCDSTVTTNLAFYSVINAAVTVNGTTITASDATATSYKWVNCSNGIPIPGATNQSFTPTTNGNYAVIVTEGSCSKFSVCTLISTVGIAQYNATNNLQVYPNPFSNELTIVSTAKTNALLFDMLGNKINEFVLQNTTQTISLSELAPGMYYLQVDNSKIKIIKQ